MKLLSGWFGGKEPAAQNPKHHSQLHSQLSSGHSPHSTKPVVSEASMRRELLRVVLKETLQRNGIPPSWITADMLTASSRGREAGIHWRLAVRHWHPRLPVHAVAIQNSLIDRVHAFDPMAHEWLLGISWQFVLDDESECPGLPHPGSWTAPEESHEVPAPTVAPGPSGDVIAGPVRIGSSRHGAKPGLDRLLDSGAWPKGGAGTEATQPMYVRTESGKLPDR